MDDLPKISYPTLVDRLTDPDADLDHYMRYMVEVTQPGRLAPELAPNPALVTDIPPSAEGGVGLGLANWFMRSRRHRAYRRRIADGWTGHRIVSEGDSWFQYPTTLRDIIDHLMVDHAILSLGAAGDELGDVIKQREILVHLQAERASALLLSAGGNDLFENGRLGKLIEDPSPGASAEALVGARFDAFLNRILADFLDLFRRVHRAFPHIHILAHGYGPAFPRGAAWIGQPLTDRGVPDAMQHDVVKVIVRKFNAGLASIAARSEFDGMIAHIDLTDIGDDRGNWHDEIHLDGPTSALAAHRFREELHRRLRGPAPESGVTRTEPLSQTVAQEAEKLAALDEASLLREVDLRVNLLEMDPSLADEAELQPLVLLHAEPEIGLASLRSATRRLTDLWEREFRDLLCGDATGDEIAEAVRSAFDTGRGTLAGVVARWLVSGPLGVPAVIASALGAWLAAKALDFGRDRLCELWTAERAAAPALLRGATDGPAPTVGEVRSRLDTPGGTADLSNDDQKTRLDKLEERVAKEAVEAPRVPVDADGATRFRRTAAEILAILGGEAEDAGLSDEDFAVAEALVVIDGSRPAPYIRDGFVDIDDPRIVDSGWRDEIVDNEHAIRQQIAASGRIIRGSDRSAAQVYGSAWMLPDGRVATARHVLEAMAIRSGGKWFLKDIFFVDFAVEADRPISADAVFKIAGVDWAGDEEIGLSVDLARIDAAILRLEPVQGRPFPDPVPLTDPGNADAILANRWFINVGHPGKPFGAWLVDDDDGNEKTISRALLLALVGDKFGVKRLSPGRIDFKPGMFPDDDAAHAMTHDATTLGGSSGSGIMSLQGGASMFGLHFAGLFGTRNYAHFVPAIRDDWDLGGGHNS